MKRVYTFIGLVVLTFGGVYLAFEASRLVPSEAAGSETYNLFSSSLWWVLPVAAFAGVFFGAFNEPREEKIVEGNVVRHDAADFFEHWAHTIGFLFLMISGVLLGFLFIPRYAATPEAVGFAMNLHFVGSMIMAFTVAYYATDLAVTGGMRELLPASSDLKDAVAHYAAKLGMAEKPKEGKYFASERMVFIVWVVCIGMIAITGLVKVGAHVWTLPGNFMSLTTTVHDVFALILIVVLALHVILGAIVPWSWPHLVSMITGNMSEENVKKQHQKWHDELTA